MLSNVFPYLNAYPELKKEILDSGSTVTFKKGTEILSEGSYIKVIPFLLSGLVKVFKEDESGHEILLYYIKEGESCVVSFTTFTNQQKSTVKGIVEQDAEIFILPAKDALRIAKSYPAFNDFFYKLFSTKYNELVHMIQVLTFSNTETRILEYLEQERDLKKTKTIQITHKQIAEELGTSREVISRLLKKLEHQGKLELFQGEISLK